MDVRDRNNKIRLLLAVASLACSGFTLRNQSGDAGAFDGGPDDGGGDAGDGGGDAGDGGGDAGDGGGDAGDGGGDAGATDDGGAHDGGTSDGGGTSDAGSCSSNDGGNCNTLASVQQIDEVDVAEYAPIFQGGLVVSGTYHLSSVFNYTGPGGDAGATGKTRAATFVIDGGSLSLAASLNGCADNRSNYLFSTYLGNNFVLLPTCPNDGLAASTSYKYSADGGVIQIWHVRWDGETQVRTYQRKN